MFYINNDVFCLVQSEAQVVARHKYRNRIPQGCNLLQQNRFARNQPHFHQLDGNILSRKCQDSGLLAGL